MAWILDPSTNEKEVAWRRNEDGFIVAFARVGLGEPSSDEKSPPDSIDKYAQPVEIAIAPALPGDIARDLALKAIAIARQSLDEVEAAVKGAQ